MRNPARPGFLALLLAAAPLGVGANWGECMNVCTPSDAFRSCVCQFYNEYTSQNNYAHSLVSFDDVWEKTLSCPTTGNYRTVGYNLGGLYNTDYTRYLGVCLACPSNQYCDSRTCQNSCSACPECASAGTYRYNCAGGSVGSCEWCTNAAGNQYYTGTGGFSATGCSVASCANAGGNQYYSSGGGTSAGTSSTCPVTACSNAGKNQYYSGGGGTSAPTSNACPLATCSTAGKNQYYSGAGGA
jgi:hypothetical protein